MILRIIEKIISDQYFDWDEYTKVFILTFLALKRIKLRLNTIFSLKGRKIRANAIL